MSRPVVQRAVTVLVATVLTLLGTTGTALAHNTLVGSDPAEGARLQEGPEQVRLTFDQPVRAEYNTVTVVGPDGKHWADGTVRVEGTTVIAPVGELGPAGTYTIGFRILSNDGHPVTDKVTFTLTEPGGGTPVPPPEEATEQPADRAEAGGMPVWPWIVGAIAFLALGLVLALRLGKPSGGR